MKTVLSVTAVAVLSIAGLGTANAACGEGVCGGYFDGDMIGAAGAIGSNQFVGAVEGLPAGSSFSGGSEHISQSATIVDLQQQVDENGVTIKGFIGAADLQAVSGQLTTVIPAGTAPARIGVGTGSRAGSDADGIMSFGSKFSK